MTCKICGSRVFIERESTDTSDFELVCNGCGRRVFVERKSRLGKWLKKNMQ